MVRPIPILLFSTISVVVLLDCYKYKKLKVGISISKYSKVKNALASNSTSFIV